MRRPRNLRRQGHFLAARGAGCSSRYRLLAAAGGLLRQSLGCLQCFCSVGSVSLATVRLHQSFGIFLNTLMFLMVFDHGFDEGAVEAWTAQHLEFQIGGLSPMLEPVGGVTLSWVATCGLSLLAV